MTWQVVQHTERAESTIRSRSNNSFPLGGPETCLEKILKGKRGIVFWLFTVKYCHDMENKEIYHVLSGILPLFPNHSIQDGQINLYYYSIRHLFHFCSLPSLLRFRYGHRLYHPVFSYGYYSGVYNMLSPRFGSCSGSFLNSSFLKAHPGQYLVDNK